MTSKLFQSIFAADAEGTRQCLDAGMDPNERGANDETPLMVATRDWHAISYHRTQRTLAPNIHDGSDGNIVKTHTEITRAFRPK